MEPTSEQELKQLLDEGRITEEEYRELLEALRQKETVQKPAEVPQQPNEVKTRTGFGKAALILMITGLVLPIAALPMSFLFTGMLLFLPCLAIGFLCGLLAFIFGIIGWKSKSGKIAAISVPCMGLLIIPGLLLLFLFGVRVEHQVYMEEALDDDQAAIAEVRADKPHVTHKHYSMDTMEGVLATENVQIIDENKGRGGALKIECTTPEKRTIRLFETGPIRIDNCILIYSATLRPDNLNGKAYLEMWCEIPDEGEFFSRGLDHPVMGIANHWIKVQTPFRLESGQMPANVKLNLVIEGTGTVWIDDIKLLSSPLSELRNKNSWR